MKEQLCDPFEITPKTLGLRVGQIQEAALGFTFDMDTLKRVFRLSEESITEVYMQIALNPLEDTGMSSFHMVMLYLYLTGRGSYRLTPKAQVRFKDKQDPLTIPEEVDVRYVIKRLRRVAMLPRRVNNVLYPLCEELLHGGALSSRKQLLRIIIDLGNDLRRPDYAYLDKHINRNSLCIQHKNTRVPLLSVHCALDVVRLTAFNSKIVSLEDIKTATKGSQTRRKKVAILLGFPLINIDTNSEPGKSLYRELHLIRS